MEYYTCTITQHPPPRPGQRFSWNDDDEAVRITDRLVFWGVCVAPAPAPPQVVHIVRVSVVYHKRNYLLFIKNCILNAMDFVNIWIARQRWRMDGRQLWSVDCKTICSIMNITSCTLCMQIMSRGRVILGTEESLLSNLHSPCKESGAAGLATHEFVFLRFRWVSMCG